MANPWFRLYHEFSDDPKVQMMAEHMQRRLIMLFCSRCKDETLHETEMAFHWRVTETELAETKSVFIKKGFIDEHWNLQNWNQRQFLSDSSTERVRRHRQWKKQDETLQKQDETEPVTAPDTEQIQNRAEQIQKTPSSGDDTDLEKLFEFFKEKSGKSSSYEFTKQRKEKGRQRWKDCLRKMSGDEEKAFELFCDAILGLVNDRWNRGEDPRNSKKFMDWIDHLCKSPEEFETRIENFNQKKGWR